MKQLELGVALTSAIIGPWSNRAPDWRHRCHNASVETPGGKAWYAVVATGCHAPFPGNVR